MKNLPITLAADPDLRSSLIAMQRAARRAREIARQTNTCLVVAEGDGSVTRISPGELDRVEAAWALEAEKRLAARHADEAGNDICDDASKDE